jgi:uncharacterized protein YdeI (YjbR/CyaY-like superfamily)
MSSASDPVRFRSAAEFRRWLRKHHAETTELWLALMKKGSATKLITYREALDEALAFGWIDGVRKSLGDDAFVIRFTPRKAKSYWSAVNVRRVEELKREGRMEAPGLETFEKRDQAATAKYSFERETPVFDATMLATFRKARAAWKFFEAQPPGYRRVATHWVTSAKREETRARRLATLIETSAKGERLAALAGKAK